MNQGLLKIVIAILVLGVGVWWWQGWGSNRIPDTNRSNQKLENSELEISQAKKWGVEVVAKNLDTPWDLALMPDGKMLITERGGKWKLLDKGNLTEVADFPQSSEIGEGGMMGIALHPNFASNNFIFVYYTYNDGGVLNRVSRFLFQDQKLQQEKVIVDKIPGASNHNGGRMRFGPDGKLYILTGDAAQPKLAQNTNSLAGKVIKVNDDQGGLSIYSMGHRNPQGLDWHPKTGELVVTEHGQSAHDELNLVKQGGNYGWPEFQQCNSGGKYTDPILCSGSETWAPSGGAFIGNSFYFAGLRGNLLKRVEIENGKVVETEDVIKGEYGRLRAVMADKEGNLYVSTSNRDGRGNPTADDDRILKLTPITR